ncbi:uncharacterized protein LOC143464811 isoform X2 [Clavelina lepadiformis]|uniref:Uncharacterized protein n=2 Tax=Clavelina lepadiformis TaxID=159417 RepID=A0ABP0F0R9_CLALP
MPQTVCDSESDKDGAGQSFVLHENMGYNDLLEKVSQRKAELELVELNGIKGYIVDVAYSHDTEIVQAEDKLHEELSNLIQKKGSKKAMKSSPSIFNEHSDNTKVHEGLEKKLNVNFKEIAKFAEKFRDARISMDVTQRQVATSIGKWRRKPINRSTISKFEMLELSISCMISLYPVLYDWLKNAQQQKQKGDNEFNNFIGVSKRKKRNIDMFDVKSTKILLKSFSLNPNPDNETIQKLSDDLNCSEKSITTWFSKHKSKNAKTNKRSSNSMYEALCKKLKEDSSKDCSEISSHVSITSKYYLQNASLQPSRGGLKKQSSTLQKKIDELKQKTMLDEKKTKDIITNQKTSS